MKIYKCYFDGSCMPSNPGGTIGYGVYITDGVNEFRKSKTLLPDPKNTNNIAEYLGFIFLLKLMNSKTNCEIQIFGDSKLVISQMRGEWEIKKGAYKPYALEAQPLLEELKKNNIVSIEWVPREQNEEADNQSKSHLTKL